MRKLAIIGLLLFLSGCTSTRSNSYWYYYDATNLTPITVGDSDMGKAANDDNAIYNGHSVESLRAPVEVLTVDPIVTINQ